MSALQPPVSEDLIVKMAALTTRDTVSLSQFQERYRRQTDAFQTQKNPPNPKITEYISDVSHRIESISQKGEETLKKLLDVLNKQGGVFSASDVAEGTANIYLYQAACKAIRRDIKYLAIFSRPDAEALKRSYVEVVSTLYDKFYGVCNEHLSQELQNRSKEREKVLDAAALSMTDRSFEYKITMADQTIDTLHKLRMDLKLPTSLKHEGSVIPEYMDSDLKKLTEELESIATNFSETNQLPSPQHQYDIVRRIRELRSVTWRVDFNTGYNYRFRMNTLLESFAHKLCNFAVMHILKKDCDARQLIGTISTNSTFIPVAQLLDLQAATSSLVDDSKKMLDAITFAIQATKTPSTPKPPNHNQHNHQSYLPTS